MTDKNRFTDLVGGLNQGDKPADKPEQQPKTDSRGKPLAKQRLKKRRVDEATSNKEYEQSVKRGHDASIGKSADPNYDKVTVYIRSDIAHALRVVSAFEKAEMSQLVEDAVEKRIRQSAIGKATLEQSDG